MDAAAFEQVYEAFQDFHAYFGPLFGRRESREHSGHISRPCWYSLGSGLLVQSRGAFSPQRLLNLSRRRSRPVSQGDAAVSHRFPLGR